MLHFVAFSLVCGARRVDNELNAVFMREPPGAADISQRPGAVRPPRFAADDYGVCTVVAGGEDAVHVGGVDGQAAISARCFFGDGRFTVQ